MAPLRERLADQTVTPDWASTRRSWMVTSGDGVAPVRLSV